MANTMLSNLVNPQVMADMISAKVTNAIVVTPYAKIDNTLAGRPGDTITVPKYAYIGDASDVAEGASVTASTLTASTVTYTVKKAMKAVTITDEALLSAYGNPVGETTNQLAKSIAAKIDADCLAALLTGSQTKTISAQISYSGIVDAIGVFDEEYNTEKVLFINPAQMTALRKDANFISADKYQSGVALTGEIGKIANCHIVTSRQIVKSGTTYVCPIVKIESDDRTEDDTPALTVYVKRGVNLEPDRHPGNETTDFVASEHYVAALTNDTKVVVATFNA